MMYSSGQYHGSEMKANLIVLFLCFLMSIASYAQEISPFGMGIYPDRYAARELPAVLQLAKEAGIKLTRVDMGWQSVEPEKGKFAWERWDAVIDSVSKYGIDMLGLFAYQPAWLSPNAPATDEERALFANYVYETVKRYKDKIHYWEIWNEPNGGSFWRSQPNVADYTRLLIASYKAARKADPQCVILAPGVSEIDRDFIRGIFENGGGDYFDVLSVHPYPSYSQEVPDVTLVWDVEAARSIMRTSGKDKPIWASEIGYPTNVKGGVSEETQASNLVRAYLQCIALGFENIMWYDFRDDGIDIRYSEHNFGILRHDYSLKPAYAALKTLTRMVDGLSFQKSVFGNKGRVRGLLFSNGKHSILALWSAKGIKEILLKVGSEHVTVTDKYGNNSTVACLRGVLEMHLSESPVYLQGFTDLSTSSESFPARIQREWLICGPFLSKQDNGLTVDHLKSVGGEGAIEPRKNETVAHDSLPSGKAEWQKYETDEDGIAELTDVFSPNEDVVAYAYCDLRSDRDRQAVIDISSDDGMKLWINHQEVLFEHQHRTVYEGERLVVVKLRKGSNPCLLKIENRKGGWGFYLRVLGDSIQE